ncbi:MAG: hypothetical protein NTY99_02490, partial [DPANN group archaeon]|nr:hypothetical protein [DPANN group archaeon]
VVNAFSYCMENFDRMKNEPYNLGLDSANISKWELCLEIKKKIPNFWFTVYSGEEWAKDPDKRNYIVSNEKLAKAGFKATTSLQDGIEELIKGYQILKRNEYSNV